MGWEKLFHSLFESKFKFPDNRMVSFSFNQD